MTFKLRYFIFSFLFIQSVAAAPIDWSGTLGVDSTIINDVRRTSDDCTPIDGSQCISSEESNARTQSMILTLNPTIIVNDGVTIKGELSTGTDRGNRLGAATNNNYDAGAYYAQSTSSTLNVNQIYAEIYADTALYKIGRFSKHFGLGAVVNGGNKVWDRTFSGYEGFEAQLKLGNFHITPMWAKLHTSGNANGKFDAYETSVSALYDNPNKNMQFGIYYSNKEVQSNATLYDKTVVNPDDSETTTSAGSQNVTLVDIYFKKQWDAFTIAMEIPMLSGEVNNFYGTGKADFDTNAYLLESSYKLNSKWTLLMNAGMVKGDDGTTAGSFEGMYLNPNYKLSSIMFNYDNAKFNSDGNIYNASIVNTTYAQVKAVYSADEWTWNMSALMARAGEVASNGSKFYDHSAKVEVDAIADQSDDMGTELNLGFDYQWNPNVVFSANLGYHLVGDYYGFTNTSEELTLTNVLSSGMKLSVKF